MAHATAFNLDAVKEICKAIGIDPSLTRRIIIDFPCDDFVKIYIEMYGSKEVLTIDWKQALDGAQVIST